MLRRTMSLLFVFSSIILSGGQFTLAQSISIFGNAVPKDPTGGGTKVTLGLKFWTSQPGTISGIRFYRAEVSSHGYVAKLYSAGGVLLGSATLAHESGSMPGWQVANFASPFPISANTTYVASYYSVAGQGAGDPYELKTGVAQGPLTAPASSAVGGNGAYSSKNVFPKSSYEASNYYVDVSFVPTEAALTLQL